MSRRRTRTAITLSVLVIMVGAMAAYGFKQATAPFPRSGQPNTPACTSREKQVTRFLKRSDVQVSVFNAGSRAGLASRTMAKIKAAGFVGGDVGNAPGTAGEVRRAVVWTTKAGDPAARLVALAVGRGTRIRVTTDQLGPGIDLIVGDRFRRLAPKAPTQVRLAKPIETCVQVD